MTELSAEDAQRLVGAVVELVSMAGNALPGRRSPMMTRLHEHLGDGDAIGNTSVSFDLIERANVQLALDDLHRDATIWEEFGLPSDVGNYGGLSLLGLADGSWRGPADSARQFMAVEVSATESIRCLRAGVIVTEWDGVAVALMLYDANRHRSELVVEIAAATQDAADAFLVRLRELMTTHNVLRGKVLTFAFGEHGNFGLAFTTIPAVTRDEVILPAWQLDAIDEHAIGISGVSDELRAAGQHLKRGLLLYGPPGTGKTHTVSYLVGRMSDRTTIILSGASADAVGQAGTLARKLVPATIVIEDVDLIGMDRGLPGGEHNPILFQLLNEMDGLQSGDDVLFVLTTNRADLLEPALAARPGRVDQALEIGLPDADGRRALFELYLHQPVDAGVIDDAVVRTDGVAAAFIKELARRATLRSIRSSIDIGAALRAAVDEMGATATPLLRASLAGVDRGSHQSVIAPPTVDASIDPDGADGDAVRMVASLLLTPPPTETEPAIELGLITGHGRGLSPLLSIRFLDGLGDGGGGSSTFDLPSFQRHFHRQTRGMWTYGLVPKGCVSVTIGEATRPVISVASFDLDAFAIVTTTDDVRTITFTMGDGRRDDRLLDPFDPTQLDAD